MRKENLYKFFYFAAGLLAAVFCITVAVDWFTYRGAEPFRMIVAGRMLQFLVPGVLALIAARVAQNKYN